MEKFRILRILEYVGTREDIEKVYKHSGVPLNGMVEHGSLTIKSSGVFHDPHPLRRNDKFIGSYSSPNVPNISRYWSTDNYKNDPILFAEEILNIKLFDYQKTILRKAYEAKINGQELIICYPCRNGRTMMNRVWNEFLKTQ